MRRFRSWLKVGSRGRWESNPEGKFVPLYIYRFSCYSSHWKSKPFWETNTGESITCSPWLQQDVLAPWIIKDGFAGSSCSNVGEARHWCGALTAFGPCILLEECIDCAVLWKWTVSEWYPFDKGSRLPLNTHYRYTTWMCRITPRCHHESTTLQS